MKLDLTFKNDPSLHEEWNIWNRFVDTPNKKQALLEALNRQRNNSYTEETEHLRNQDYWLMLGVARKGDYERAGSFIAQKSRDFFENSGYYQIPYGRTEEESRKVQAQKTKIFRNQARIAIKGILDMIEFEVIPDLED